MKARLKMKRTLFQTYYKIRSDDWMVVSYWSHARKLIQLIMTTSISRTVIKIKKMSRMPTILRQGWKLSLLGQLRLANTGGTDRDLEHIHADWRGQMRPEPQYWILQIGKARTATILTNNSVTRMTLRSIRKIYYRPINNNYRSNN